MQMVHFIPPGQRRLALMAAQADSAPVLIAGEDGTGKSAIARWVHANGPRAAGPFIVATHESKRREPAPPSLADQIVLAHGGTLVIDELGAWTLSEQRVLLNLLTTSSVLRDGTPMLVNTRLMATTAQNLEGRAQGGLFNAELLQKLNVFRLEMPPLRERMTELEDIAAGILGEIARELRKDHLRSFSEGAWERLREYDWPGNLRELRNVLRISAIAAAGDRIEAADLPDFGPHRVDFHATREQFEKTYITELLKTFDWQIDKTCQMTSMDRATLLGKIEKYGIPLTDTPPPGPSPAN